MATPLLVVELVLRHIHKDGAALDLLGRLIASYLGPDRNLPLSDACKLGSTTLLDWMWECSPTSTTDRTPTWSLLNYLRSDPHYYEYQFYESVLEAAWKGDLRVLEWLLEHFSGCDVPVWVVEKAVEKGRMDILRSLLEHDTGRRGNEAPSRIKNGEGNVVHWGGSSLVTAAQKKRFDIVQFLYENTPRDVYEETLDMTIRFVLDAEEMNLVDGAAAYEQLEMLEWLHANRSEGYSHFGISLAGHNNHIEVLKWLVSLSPKKLKGSVMDSAAYRGDLALVQWLHTKAKARCTVPVMISAARFGRLEVLKYLSSHRPKTLARESCATLTQEALAKNHFRVAHWCLTHLPAHSPKPIEMSVSIRFETLLFVRFHYPEMFTPAYVAQIREKTGSYGRSVQVR